jgi:hypothetical protein
MEGGNPPMTDGRKQALKEKLAQIRLNFRTLLMRLNEEQWNTEVYHGDEPWTVVQLARHVIRSERGLAANVQRIREGGGGVPPDFDLMRWNRSRQLKMADVGPKDLLAEMAENRAKTLELIDDLNDEDWAKEGRAPWLEIITVEQFMNRIWEHETEHATDIAKAVGLTIE